MFLVYTPEGQPEQRWHFQPGRLRTGDMILLEKHSGGMKYGQEFKQQLLMGSTVARRALLWLFLHRDHRTLDIRDVDFFDDELVLVQDKDELAAEIAAVQDFDGMPETERAAGLALLRSQLADAPDAPGKAPAGHASPPTTPASAPALPDPLPVNTESAPPAGWIQDGEGRWLPPSLPEPVAVAAATTSPHSPGL